MEPVGKTELMKKVMGKMEDNGYAVVSKAQFEREFNCIIDTIQSEVVAGNKVTITGFGTFEQIERAARTGVNPQNGEKLDIPASKGVHFKAGAGFKKAVREA